MNDEKNNTSYKIIGVPQITQSRIIPVYHYHIPRSRIQSAPFHLIPFTYRYYENGYYSPYPFRPCLMLYVNSKELYVTCLNTLPSLPKRSCSTCCSIFPMYGRRRCWWCPMCVNFLWFPLPRRVFEVRWFYMCYQFMLPVRYHVHRK